MRKSCCQEQFDDERDVLNYRNTRTGGSTSTLDNV